ncbi:hypothetical protein AVEN_106487-1 [Araneus ventricosus]|uniref:Reverse transcriptase zinc-binding domain-containing protein n=1 Tax=Araneus ventricosus TaxID=182803 RepID=A0A4Y2T5B9_ARAVE|nr:hypothetical protein AVEN_106487-1 [Araneus ventricosus]
MIDSWQSDWTRGKTGRSIHNIFPQVKLRLTDWRREDFLFFTGHGPFAHSLFRFRLKPTPFCACGKEGTPLHYITECDLTESWHITKPAANLKDLWFRRVAGNPHSRAKVRQVIKHMLKTRTSFSRTSITSVKTSSSSAYQSDKQSALSSHLLHSKPMPSSNIPRY